MSRVPKDASCFHCLSVEEIRDEVTKVTSAISVAAAGTGEQLQFDDSISMQDITVRGPFESDVLEFKKQVEAPVQMDGHAFFQLVQHLPSANPAATEPPAQLTTPPPSTDTPANVSDFQHNAAGRCDLRSIFEVAGISDADLQRWIDNGDIADDAIDILNDPDCQLPLQ